MPETAVSGTRFVANNEISRRKIMKEKKSLILTIAVAAACCAFGAVAGGDGDLIGMLAGEGDTEEAGGDALDRHGATGHEG